MATTKQLFYYRNFTGLKATTLSSAYWIYNTITEDPNYIVGELALTKETLYGTDIGVYPFEPVLKISYPTNTASSTTFSGQMQIIFSNFKNTEGVAYQQNFTFTKHPCDLALIKKYGYDVIFANYTDWSENYELNAVEEIELINYLRNSSSTDGTNPIKVKVKIDGTNAAKGATLVKQVQVHIEAQEPEPIYSPPEFSLTTLRSGTNETSTSNLSIAPHESYQISFDSTNLFDANNPITQFIIAYSSIPNDTQSVYQQIVNYSDVVNNEGLCTINCTHELSEGKYYITIISLDQYGNQSKTINQPYLQVESSLSDPITDFTYNGQRESIIFIGTQRSASQYYFHWKESKNGLNNFIDYYKLQKETTDGWIDLQTIRMTNIDCQLSDLGALPGNFRIVSVNKYPSNGVYTVNGPIIKIVEIPNPEKPIITSSLPAAIFKDCILTWDNYQPPQNTTLSYNIYCKNLTDENEKWVLLKHQIIGERCEIDFLNEKLPKDVDISFKLERVLTVGYNGQSISSVETNAIFTGSSIESEPILAIIDTSEDNYLTVDSFSYFFEKLYLRIRPPKVNKPKVNIYSTLYYNINNSNWIEYKKYLSYQAETESTFGVVNDVKLTDNIQFTPGTKLGLYISYTNSYGQEVNTIPVYINRMPLPNLESFSISNITEKEIIFTYIPNLNVPNEKLTYKYELGYDDYTKEYTGTLNDSGIMTNPQELNFSLYNFKEQNENSNDVFLTKLYEKVIINKNTTFPGTLKITLASASLPACKITKNYNFSYNFKTPANSGNFYLKEAKEYYNPNENYSFIFKEPIWKDASGDIIGADITYKIVGNNKTINCLIDDQINDFVAEASKDLIVQYKLITTITYADAVQQIESDPLFVNIARWYPDEIRLISVHKDGQNIKGIISLPSSLCSSNEKNNFKKLTCNVKGFKVNEGITEEIIEVPTYNSGDIDLPNLNFVYTPTSEQEIAIPNNYEIPFTLKVDNFKTVTLQAVVTFVNNIGQQIEQISKDYILQSTNTTIAIRNGRVGINVDNDFNIDLNNPKQNIALVVNSIDEKAPALELNIRSSEETDEEKCFALLNNTAQNFTSKIYHNENNLLIDNLYYPVTSINNKKGDITFNFPTTVVEENLDKTTITIDLPKDFESELNEKIKINIPVNKSEEENNFSIHYPVTSVNDQIGNVKIEIPVQSVNNKTGNIILTPEDINTFSFKTTNDFNFEEYSELSKIYSDISKQTIFYANGKDYWFISNNNLPEDDDSDIIIINYNNDFKEFYRYSNGVKYYGIIGSGNEIIWDKNYTQLNKPTPAEIGARDNTWLPTPEEINCLTKDQNYVINELDNSYFPMIIDQKKSTNGYTVTANEQYTYDRWVAAAGENDSISITIENGYLHLGNGEQQYYTDFKQFLSEDYTDQPITLAIKTDQEILCCSFVAVKEVPSPFRIIKDENGENLGEFGLEFNNEKSLYYFIIRVNPQKIIKLEWVAMYKGLYDLSTLPSYRYKGYLTELQNCQRYFYCRPTYAYFTSAYTSNTKNLYCFITTPVPMRIKPTVGNATSITYIRGAGQGIDTKYTSSTGTFSVDSFDGSENFRILYIHNTSDAFTKLQFYGINISKFVLDANL